MDLIEQLTKAHHSAMFLNNELRELYSGNQEDNVLNLIIYDLLGESAKIEDKIGQILSTKKYKNT